MSDLHPILFTRGVPPSEAFPVELVADCARAALTNDPSVLLQYGKSAGYLPLRQWLAGQNGVEVERVLASNGSLQIMDFICATLLRPGDTVYVESPSYDRAITIFRRHGARVVGVPLQADGVDLDALKEALTQAPPKLFYVIGDFQNPAGVTTSLVKRQQLVALAEEFDFLLIEDIPYRALRYAGEELDSLLSLAPDRVLQLSSFSKLLSPGMRTGFVIAPMAVGAKLARFAEDTYIMPVLPTQGIVYEFCRRGLLAENVERLRGLYRPRLQAALAALDRELPDAQYARPEGGYFIGVTMPEGVGMAELLRSAAQLQLTLTNGDGFFVEKPARAFVRIPFCSVSPADIEDGICRLAEAARRAG